MDYEVVRFDPETATREEWRRFHAYRRLRHRETDPEDPDAEDATVEAWMRRPHPQWQPFHFAVIHPERPDAQIGELYFEISRPGSPSHEENRHNCFVGIEVLRPYRGKGLARRLLAKAVALAHEHGRTMLQGWVQEDDGKAFAAAIGAEVAQRRRENRLRLDRVDWAMVQGWAHEGPARNPETRLRWFVDRIDDDALASFATVFTEVFNQQPFDNTAIGRFVFLPEHIRDRESRQAEAGSKTITAVTQEPSGEISGLTEMSYDPGRPTMLWQMLTGVRDVHRGRGLGKWIKAAMLLRVREEFPQARVVVTGNASSNEAMLSINERLGFRTHKEPVVVQMTRERAEAYLARASTAVGLGGGAASPSSA